MRSHLFARTSFRVALFWVALGCLWVSPSLVRADALNAEQRETALTEICTVIAENYVFTELRAPLIERLQAGQTAGRYDVTEPANFVALVNEDLQDVSHDGHLYLRADPAEYAATLAPPKSDAGLEAHRRELAVRAHHGLSKLELLPGNIRLLKITGFKWVPGGATIAAYDDAARFLAEGDAVILDLRGNGGGESDAADYCIEHIIRANAQPTDPAVVTKPVYILIDRYVGSAAEAVSYGAQLEGTAVLVGATTYGAANNNKRFPVAPQFILSVSYHRPIHPLSGTNWEGVGVSPDIAIDPDQAGEAAQIDALAKLAATPGTPAERAADYQWIRAGLLGKLHPPAMTAAQLTAAVGHYGPIELRNENEVLRLYRPDRPNWPQGVKLSPLTDDGIFAMTGTDDLRVRISDSGLELLRRNGSVEPFSRTTAE